MTSTNPDSPANSTAAMAASLAPNDGSVLPGVTVSSDMKSTATHEEDASRKPTESTGDDEPREPPGVPPPDYSQADGNLKTTAGLAPDHQPANTQVDETTSDTLAKSQPRDWKPNFMTESEGLLNMAVDPSTCQVSVKSQHTGSHHAASTRHWDSMVGTSDYAATYTVINAATWERTAKPLREKASKNRDLLHMLMKNHGDLIIDTWAGDRKAEHMTGKDASKSRKAVRTMRKDLIDKHWPNMAPNHRPDLQLLMRRKPTDGLLPDTMEENPSTQEAKAARQKREALLWPHLNKEYLVNRCWNLIQMLQSRSSQNEMAAFALADMPPNRQLFLELFLPLRSVPGHFMTIRDSAGSYGKLQPLCQTVALYYFGRYRVLPPGPGLLLLEVQARQYSFLADMASELLGRAQRKATTLKATPPLVRTYPRLLSTAAPAQPIVWAADERDEAPYTGSEAQFRGDASSATRRAFHGYLVGAKLQEARDHWRLLRCDLPYFMETVSDWRAHRMDVSADVQERWGSSHDSWPNCSPESPEGVAWTNAIKDCVMTAFQKVLYWDEARRRLKWLQTGVLEARPIPGLEASKKKIGDASEDHALRILRNEIRSSCFLFSLLSQWEGPWLLLLRKLLTFSPAFRAFIRPRAGEGSDQAGTPGSLQEAEDWAYEQPCEFDAPKKAAPRKAKKRSKGKGKAVGDTAAARKKRREWEHLDWLLNCLFDPKVRQVMGLQTILDELDHLLNSSPKAMKSPPQEYTMLSDLVLSQLSDLAAHSQLFHAEFKSYENTACEMRNLLEDERALLAKEEQMFSYRWKGGYIAPLAKAAAAGTDSASVTVGQESQGAFRYEGNPLMWSTGLVHIQKVVLAKKNREDAQAALRDFWVSLDQDMEARNVHVGHLPSRKIDDINNKGYPEGVLQHWVEGRCGTDGTSVRTPWSVETDDEPETDEDEQYLPPWPRHKRLGIRLDVDEKALKVFKTMLEPPTADLPPPVAWDDFLHALNQADFKLYRRYGGELLAVGSNLAIIFRQPRIGSKLSVATLRRYGKRMIWAAKGKLGYSQFIKRKEKGGNEGENRDQSGSVDDHLLHPGHLSHPAATAYYVLRGAELVRGGSRQVWTPAFLDLSIESSLFPNNP